MRPRNSAFYLVQHKYTVFRSSTHNAATLPRSTHIRKTYHPFTIGRIKADFNLHSLRMKHPKSKSKEWKSNSEFDSASD